LMCIFFVLKLIKCATNCPVTEPTAHSHAPTMDQLPVVELKNEIISKAADSEEATNAAGRLPQTESLLRTIRRQRQAEPTTPGNRLPDQLKQTDRGESFVLHEDKDLIIFTTNSNLSVLKTCKHWFADGTFSVSPEDFYQMFTLHGLFKSQVIPLVFNTDGLRVRYDKIGQITVSKCPTQRLFVPFRSVHLAKYSKSRITK
ncbi:unnamed protein product, partial [Adineta ricciae]